MVTIIPCFHLITGCYAKRDDSRKMLCAEDALTSLENEKFSPSVDLLIRISIKCRKDRNRTLGSRLSAYIRKCHLQTHPSLGNYLVSMLVDIGELQDARMIFEDLESPSEHSWTSIITGYVQQEKPEYALNLYHRMVNDTILQPSGHTYVAVLKACAKLKNLESGMQIHAEILRNGKFDQNLFICNSLIDMYAKCALLARAVEIFNNLVVRDVVSWNSLITAYVICEAPERAMNCLELMQHEGVCPNAVTFICILKACSIVRSVDKGLEIHTKIVCYGLLETDPAVASTLISLYAKLGFLAKAREVFENLQTHTIISWTALITGYVEYDQNEEALHCFHLMQQEGFAPNVVTYLCCLKACGAVGAMNKGEEMYKQISETGVKYLILDNILIDMYSKCGSLSRAQEVFDKLQSHDVVSWTSLIAGYGQFGKCESVFTIFSKMIQKGIKADQVTFISILNACSHAGFVERGQRCFNMMLREHSISPTLELYTCMVDLHGRAGRLAEAVSIIEDMPFASDSTIWKTLLSACRKWGNVEIGRLAFNQAMGLNIMDPATYILADLGTRNQHEVGTSYSKSTSPKWQYPNLRKVFGKEFFVMGRVKKGNQNLVAKSANFTEPKLIEDINILSSPDEADMSKVYYRVTITTGKSYESGMSDLSAGILLALIGEEGKCFLSRLSPLASGDGESTLNGQCQNSHIPVTTHQRFQRSSSDVFMISGPNLGKLQAAWIGPEKGTWRMDKLSVIVVPEQMVANDDPDVEKTIDGGIVQYDFKDLNLLVGDGGEVSAAELKASKASRLTYPEYLTLLLKNNASIKKVAEARAKGMKEYEMLKLSLFSYDAFLVILGTAVSLGTGHSEIARGFFAGGLSGLLYLFFLQQAVDRIPAPNNTDNLHEESNEFDKSSDTFKNEEESQFFGNFAGFRTPFTRIAVTVLCLGIIGKVLFSDDEQIISKEILFAGAAGFLMSKISTVLASTKPLHAE